MIIGYTTGTFDYFHEGHIRILQCMRKQCDVLIVGLTTDELALRHKRPTIMSFGQRRIILENCKWVSHVVEHHGESKIKAFEKLRFDKLFIGDDYFGSPEYDDLVNMYPEVQLVTIPRTSTVSTTQLLEELNIRMWKEMKIMYIGVGSSVIRRLDHLVIKSIPLGWSEVNGRKTSNVYQFPIPVPRNWAKINTPAKHPNYPGVNGYRELLGGAMWRGKPWYPIFDEVISFRSNQLQSSLPQLQEKARPYMIVDLIGRDGGETLATWIETRYEENQLHELLKSIVKIIIHEFQDKRFVHGDVHCRNVLVNEKLQVSLIDFGWCTHDSFVMSEEESKEHDERVKGLFDLYHFQDSLEKLFVEEMQRPDLWLIHKFDLVLFAEIHD